MPPKIVAIGETLWDLLPGGRQLGGAPANFAFHARQLGAEVAFISRVGADAAGREARTLLAERGLSMDLMQIDPAAPTGTVTVEFDGQAPNGVSDADSNGVSNAASHGASNAASHGAAHRFIIHTDVAWDRLEAPPEALAAAHTADAVCFGTLGQRSPAAMRAIQTLVAAAPADSLRVFDINLRQQFYTHEVIETSLALASALKVNDDELPVLAHMFSLTGEPAAQLTELIKRFELTWAVLTRGRHGSLLVGAGGVADFAGTPVDVVDSIGAGDAFTAALVVGHLAGWSLERKNTLANEVAAEVCRHAGAMPLLPPETTAKFHSHREVVRPTR